MSGHVATYPHTPFYLGRSKVNTYTELFKELLRNEQKDIHLWKMLGELGAANLQAVVMPVPEYVPEPDDPQKG
jgi:hypothetical protein